MKNTGLLLAVLAVAACLIAARALNPVGTYQMSIVSDSRIAVLDTRSGVVQIYAGALRRDPDDKSHYRITFFSED